MQTFSEQRGFQIVGYFLGAVIALAFFGLGVGEIRSFENKRPAHTACLGFDPSQCLAAGSAQGPDRHQLNEERAKAQKQANAQTVAQNRRAARERRRRQQSGGSNGSTPGRSAPGATTPTPGSGGTPTQTPAQPPTGTGNQPQPTTPSPARPNPPANKPPPANPNPPAKPKPPPGVTVNPPTVPAPVPQPPPVTVPLPQPPVNVPTPPVPGVPPVQICTPVAGVNCPPGSRQARRLSGRGPGNEDAPVRVGADPDGYDLDPTTPSDHVNGGSPPS